MSPRVVIEEAAVLADEVGWDGLTLSRLAARLRVQVPSLYKHVDGLDAVRRGVTILAVRELGEALASALAQAAGQGAGRRLAALAGAYRTYASAHPGRYAATIRAAPRDDPEHGAASRAVLESVLEVLHRRGLSGDDAIDAARALRASLHGFVTLEAAGGFGLPLDVDRSFARLIAALDRAFAG